MDRPPRILLVDDEPDFREIFGAKLTKAGFFVESAPDAQRAIVQAEGNPPDLILLDVKMPGMGGVDALYALQHNPALSRVPVVFLTALGDPRADLQELNRKVSREIGAIDYIRKDADLDTVVARIKSILP